MGQIMEKTVIEADIDTVWGALADVGRVSTWHPKVARSPVLSANNTGMGAQRRCEFYDGTSVVETVVAVKDRSFVEMELSEFSMPFKTASGRMEVRALSPQRTEVKIIMTYEMKFGPVGWLMEATMIKPMMGKMMGQVLGSLGHHVLTGETIGENGPRVRAA